MTHQELPSYDQAPAGAIRFNTDSRKLEVYCGGPAAACSSTRGVLMGGRNNTPASATTHNTIQYITISSTGDAIDFGDLTRAQRFGNGTSNGSRAVQMGGANPGAQNNIDYFEIDTLGNAQDFGNLTSNLFSGGSLSDSHGGLG